MPPATRQEHHQFDVLGLRPTAAPNQQAERSPDKQAPFGEGATEVMAPFIFRR